MTNITTNQNLPPPVQNIPTRNAPRMISILDLPVLGSKGSPKRFRGDHAKVATFLDHYDQLCTQYNLTSERDRCRAMLRYCNRKVRETIEGLASYRNPDYIQLKSDMLQIYDDEKLRKRFKKKDLDHFLKYSRKKKIRTLSDFRRYEREFIRIAGWLKGEGKISENDYNNAFWKGLPGSMCHQLEFRLVAKDPMHDMRRAFDVEDVVKAAEKALQRDRFDADRSDAEDESSNDEDSEESSSDDDDDDESDKEDATVKRRRRLVKKVYKHRNEESVVKKKKSKDKNDDDDDDWTITPRENDMESLIRKMEKLSVNTAQYAVLWYRAVKLDPKVETILARPRVSGQYQSPAYAVNQRNIPETRPPPPHMYPTPMRTSNRPPNGEIECYGCGERGHGVGQCEGIAKLLKNEILGKDQRGRLVWKNGDRISRLQDETFIKAVERQGVSAHLVTLAAMERVERHQYRSLYYNVITR
jgi:hypothetical protein